MPKGLYNYEGVKDAEVKKPSKQWVKDFMKNHPELSDRTPMALGKERALVNKHSLSLWFNDMKRHLDKVDVSLLLSPDRLYNADETGFSLCLKGKKVIVFEGDKHVYTMSANTKQNYITVVVCTSANGRFLPPPPP